METFPLRWPIIAMFRPRFRWSLMYKPPPAFPLLVVEAPHVTHTRSEEPTASTTHDGDALAVDVELASMLVAALPDASKNAGFPAHVPYMCPPAGAGATSGTTTCVCFLRNRSRHACGVSGVRREGGGGSVSRPIKRAGLLQGQSSAKGRTSPTPSSTFFTADRDCLPL